MTSLAMRPLSPVIGVEVDGLDVGALADRGVDPSDPVVSELREAWLTHHLLLFRNQLLSGPQQATVGSWFGTLETTTPQAMQRGEEPEGPVHYISNRVERGRAGDGEVVFHSDSAARPHPIRAVMLFAMTIPAVGGDTLYANCVHAHRQLPPGLRARIRGLDALHALDYEDPEKGTGGGGFQAAHPVAMPHPLTDEPVLYLSRNATRGIVGLAADESDALLTELFDHIETAGPIYRHRWRVGDLVIWDNVALVHARTAFDPAEPRTLQRVTVSGVPVPGERWPARARAVAR